ncbi:phosphatase PAP2 family protein [Pedobacter africanus]|uniref:PAP2 superfamily protein n=1 Tax=Pedobacter africanus TaxID=151894 RepID=A0A1W2DXR7_9SPHI|nr:phosphatase PAP2 family protein [Pedobacter africanus]SMD01892.1 PAP2 superfamily protein [Pedobacter africanus]
MMRLKYMLLLCFCLPFFCYCQQAGADTVAKKNSFKIAPFIIPAVFLGYGAMAGGDNFVHDLDVTTRAELQEDHPFFSVKADNFMQYAPAAAVYALNLSGVKGKHNLVDATGIYAISFGLMKASTLIVKSATHRLRPDGSTYNSFPSGHTATSFAAAEFLKQEYKDVSPWYGYAGYTVATATGIMRLYNNRHWVSDVVAGAGFGIIATKVSYLVYPKLKQLIAGKRQQDFSLVPIYQEKAFGFSFASRF